MFINKIKVSNFSGIKDLIEIDFTEGGKSEKDGYFNLKEDRVSLINGFYGANASGKTTILNTIDKIFEIMIAVRPEFSISQTGLKQENIICYQNFHIDMDGKPTEFEITFTINNNKYIYSLTILDGKNIIKESLFKNKDEVFVRVENSIKFNEKYKELENTFEKYIISSKTSFVSQLINMGLSPKAAENIISDIKSIPKKTCFITDKRMVNMGQDNINGIFNVAFNYLNNPGIDKEVFLGNLNSITKFFEPSLDEIVLKQKDTQTIEYGLKYKNSNKLLPVMEASAGTRELISYINDILNILKVGGIVVYDETSKYYHPDMEISILNLFKDKDINKNNAQIFFSSHNHETFDLLHINQSYIVEKENDVVLVNKVSDFDIQERDNLKKKYRLGSLGGVPDTIDFKRVINNLL